LTEQLPDARVQEPVEPAVENVTVPVGELPLTVAVQVVVALTATGLGEQSTVIVVETSDPSTVTVNVPELGPLFESPLYVAVMVTSPGEVPTRSYTEQLPDARMHEPTTVPSAVRSTVPAGEFPVTVAVQVVEALTAIVLGSHTRIVVVGAKDPTTVMVKTSELGSSFESPS
jgi:hypothetical protein